MLIAKFMAERDVLFVYQLSGLTKLMLKLNWNGLSHKAV